MVHELMTPSLAFRGLSDEPDEEADGGLLPDDGIFPGTDDDEDDGEKTPEGEETDNPNDLADLE